MRPHPNPLEVAGGLLGRRLNALAGYGGSSYRHLLSRGIVVSQIALDELDGVEPPPEMPPFQLARKRFGDDFFDLRPVAVLQAVDDLPEELRSDKLLALAADARRVYRENMDAYSEGKSNIYWQLDPANFIVKGERISGAFEAGNRDALCSFSFAVAPEKPSAYEELGYSLTAWRYETFDPHRWIEELETCMEQRPGNRQAVVDALDMFVDWQVRWRRFYPNFAKGCRRYIREVILGRDADAIKACRKSADAEAAT